MSGGSAAGDLVVVMAEDLAAQTALVVPEKVPGFKPPHKVPGSKPAGSVWNLTMAQAKALGLSWGACPGCGRAGAVSKGIPVENVADDRFHHSSGTKLKRHQCGGCGGKDFELL